MSVSTSTGTASIPSTAKDKARTSTRGDLLRWCPIRSGGTDRPRRRLQPAWRGARGGVESGASDPVRQAERFFTGFGGQRRRAEAVPVIQAQEPRGVFRKIRT